MNCSKHYKRLLARTFHLFIDLVQPSKSQKSQKVKTKGPKMATRGVKVTAAKIPKFSATGPKTKRGRRGVSGASDVDSVMTEDFENQFHKIMVKQVHKVHLQCSA